MELIFFWVVMAIACAAIASAKDRSAFGFFIYGLFLWPIALIHALVMRSGPVGEVSTPVAEGVIAGVPYWRDSAGQFVAYVNGALLAFPSREMLEAAICGRDSARPERLDLKNSRFL